MNTALLQRLTDARRGYREQARLLRRVRRLYMRIAWPAIAADPTNATINLVARRMLEHSMYAGHVANLKPVRWSLLRFGWRFETGGPSRFGHRDGWHFWMSRNNWHAPDALRVTENKKATA